MARLSRSPRLSDLFSDGVSIRVMLCLNRRSYCQAGAAPILRAPSRCFERDHAAQSGPRCLPPLSREEPHSAQRARSCFRNGSSGPVVLRDVTRLADPVFDRDPGCAAPLKLSMLFGMRVGAGRRRDFPSAAPGSIGDGEIPIFLGLRLRGPRKEGSASVGAVGPGRPG
jgi:hypothetical protein